MSLSLLPSHKWFSKINIYREKKQRENVDILRERVAFFICHRQIGRQAVSFWEGESAGTACGMAVCLVSRLRRERCWLFKTL